MSLQNKEQHCALCHAILFPEDDVVYCPECGAPHHRECYNSINHCALEEFHGTENQYDKLKRAAEEMEAEKQRQEAQSEPEFKPPFTTYSPIDFLGGVKPDETIADGVTAKDAAQFVFSNTMRYIPKFKRGRKPSWNLLAFFFPCGWFFSRKMYKNGIIAGCLQVVASMLSVPYQLTLINLGIDPLLTSPQALDKLTQNIDKISPILFLALGAGAFISVLVMVLSGIFGDWIYRQHVIKSVREINATSEDKATDYRKKGGVNPFTFLIAAMAVRYIPSLIALFL